jgi:hypothetical protein
MRNLDNPEGWQWFAQRQAERDFPFPKIVRMGPEEMLVETNPAHYFSVGKGAVVAIRAGLHRAGMPFDQVKRILDIPSGAGRVMRMLQALWPQAELGACDIYQPGVDFCAETFDAKPIYSTNPITQVKTDGDYDLVWVGSLLTHLGADRWPEMLCWFRDQLRTGGVLIFSSQGQGGMDMLYNGNDYQLGTDRVAELVGSYQDTGFGYVNYPNVDGYGISFSSLEWIQAQIESVGNLRYVYTAERGWDGHQDVTTCVKVEP